MASPDMTNEELDEELKRRTKGLKGQGLFYGSNHKYWQMAEECGRFWRHGDEDYDVGVTRIRGGRNGT